MSLIKVDDISFKYNKYILKDISFDVEKACFVSLLGINGAGKSTLLKQLVRLLKPEKGAIYIYQEIILKRYLLTIWQNR